MIGEPNLHLIRCAHAGHRDFQWLKPEKNLANDAYFLDNENESKVSADLADLRHAVIINGKESRLEIKDSEGKDALLEHWLGSYESENSSWHLDENKNHGIDFVLLTFNLFDLRSPYNVKCNLYPQIRKFSKNVPIILVGVELNTEEKESNKYSCSDSDIRDLRDFIQPKAYYKASKWADKLIQNIAETGFNVKKQKLVSGLMQTADDEEASSVLSKYDLQLSDFASQNNEDENMAHVFLRRGLKKSMELLLETVLDLKSEINETLMRTFLTQKDHDKGNTIIMSSVVYNQKYIFEQLLLLTSKMEKKMDIWKTCNFRNENFVHILAKQGHPELMDALTKNTLYFENEKEKTFMAKLLKTTEKYGNTPLMIAAIYENNECFKQLFEFCRNVDFSLTEIRNQNEQNYFHVFGTLGLSKLIGMIKGALDFRNEDDKLYLSGLLRQIDRADNTPIMSAANNNQNKTFNELLSLYCDVNLHNRSVLKMQNSKGENVIHILARNGFAEMVGSLLGRITMNIANCGDKIFFAELLCQKDNCQMTPLEASAFHYNHKTCFALFSFYHKIDSFTPEVQYTDNEKFTHVLNRISFSKSMYAPAMIYSLSKELMNRAMKCETVDDKKALKAILTHKYFEGLTLLHFAAEQFYIVEPFYIQGSNNVEFELYVECLINLTVVYHNCNVSTNLSHISHTREKTDQENCVHILSRHGRTKDFEKLTENARKLGDENKMLRAFFLHTDKGGNTPIMCAALHEQSEILAKLLLFYYGDHKETSLKEMLHVKNNNDATILHIIHNSSKMMLGPHGILLELEKRSHMKDEEDKNGFLELQKCLRKNNGSSAKTMRSLKLLKETLPISTKVIALVCIWLCIKDLLLPWAMYLLDVVTDSLMVKTFYERDWIQNDNYTIDSFSYITRSNQTCKSLIEYPRRLSGLAKCVYSITFIAGPWVFYGYEFLRDNFSNTLKEEVRKMVGRNFESKIAKKWLTRAIMAFLVPFCIIIWPLIAIFRRFYYRLQHERSKGGERIAMEKELRETSHACARSRLLEASIEATFQPLLQWYLLYPKVVHIILTESSTFGHLTDNLLPHLSIVSSIFSLARAFSFYKADNKNGALDSTVAPVSMAILLASDLLFILSRITLIVMFAYSFGPGEFYPGIAFLMGHLIVIILLHNCLTDAFTNLTKGNYLRYFHGCFLNGLANILCNNGEVILDTEKKIMKGKTFIRHSTYDVIFLVENCILAYFGYNLALECKEEEKARNLTITASLVSHLIGLLLKIIYYKKFHLWSDLISVLHKKPKNENGNEKHLESIWKYWKVYWQKYWQVEYIWVFETEFNFLGSKKKVKFSVQAILNCFYAILSVFLLPILSIFFIVRKVFRLCRKTLAK